MYCIPQSHFDQGLPGRFDECFAVPQSGRQEPRNDPQSIRSQQVPARQECAMGIITGGKK